MQRKKIALLSGILMATLVVGVFAAITLSNVLTADFTVADEPLLHQWIDWSPDGKTLYRGALYYPSIRLYNPTTSTFENVIVRFELSASGYAIPTDSVAIKYWDGDSWEPMGIDSWGTTVKGYFGPTTGFPVGPGYDQTTALRFMLNADAPITGYNVKVWSETV